jgi:hypothetical protein
MVRMLPTKVIVATWNWAPGGHSFVLAGMEGSRSGVYRIDAQTGEISTVFLNPPGGDSDAPQLSPDGKTLYFLRSVRAGTWEKALIKRDMTSGAETELTRREFPQIVSLSPDGKYLTWSSFDRASNSRTMLLIPTSGGEPRVAMRVPFEGNLMELGNISAILRGPSILSTMWSADSRSFLTRKRAADEKQDDEVWRVFVNGDVPQKVGLRLSRSVTMWPSLHPDGQRLAYTINDSPSREARQELWAFENFLPSPATHK